MPAAENHPYFEKEKSLSDIARDHVQRMQKDKSTEGMKARTVLLRKKSETGKVANVVEIKESPEVIFNKDLQKTVDEIYPWIPELSELTDPESKKYTSFDKEKYLPISTKMSSWRKFGDEAESMLRDFVKTHSKEAIPNGSVISLKAMIDWENVFTPAESVKESLPIRYEKALRSLLLADAWGCESVGHLSQEQVKLAVVDVLALGRYLNILNDEDGSIEKFEELKLKSVVDKAEGEHGKNMELRLYYIFKKTSYQTLHATPFMDNVRDGRVDISLVNIQSNSKDLYITAYNAKLSKENLKSDEMYALPDTDTVYEIVKKDNSLRTTEEKKSVTRFLHYYEKKYPGVLQSHVE